MLSPKEACDIMDAIGSPGLEYILIQNMMAYGYPEQ